MNNLSPNSNNVTEANRQYYNQVASDYMKNEAYAYTLTIKNSVLQLLAFAAAHAPSRDTFLDFGCGSGFLSSLVSANNLMKSGLGIDISEEQIKLYNQNLDGTNFLGEVGDITATSKKDNSIDMAAGYSVLHHFYNYNIVIQEITRLLKQGGVFYVDFEPNRQFKQLFSLPIALRRRFLDRSPNNNDPLEQLAEYHNNFEPGICRKKLLRFLEDDYTILKTGHRIPSLKFGADRCLQLLSQVAFAFSPCFFVIAKKK